MTCTTDGRDARVKITSGFHHYSFQSSGLSIPGAWRVRCAPSEAMLQGLATSGHCIAVHGGESTDAGGGETGAAEEERRDVAHGRAEAEARRLFHGVAFSSGLSLRS